MKQGLRPADLEQKKMIKRRRPPFVKKVMVFLIIMILAILVTLCLGSFKYIQQKYRKKRLGS